MSQEALDSFGEILITRVRDKAILHWKMVMDGRMKDEDSVNFRKELERMPSDAKSICSALIPQVIDTVLHHLLWTLEQRKDIRLEVLEDSQFIDVNEVSDGLP